MRLEPRETDGRVGRATGTGKVAVAARQTEVDFSELLNQNQ